MFRLGLPRPCVLAVDKASVQQLRRDEQSAPEAPSVEPGAPKSRGTNQRKGEFAHDRHEGHASAVMS